jgi:hypothetical protein
MSLSRKFSVAGLSAVLMAVLVGAVFASSALAQPALPYKAYGSGLRAGQVVAALKGTSTEVARATVDVNGNWSMDIAADKANPGDAIRFTLDGAPTNQAITFQNGLFPLPPGLALTLATTVAPTPAPAKTGNAGLAGQSAGSSAAIVLALGAVAFVMAAGARAVTRNR